jgi:ketosteroid isomerase-like protein
LAGELETVLREHFSAFDRKDLDAALRVVHEDAEGVDEISRRWMRGRDAIQGVRPAAVPSNRERALGTRRYA